MPRPPSPVRPARVAILGFSGSGKTAYVWSLHRLSRLGRWRAGKAPQPYWDFVAAIKLLLPNWQATRLDENRWNDLPLRALHPRNWLLRRIFRVDLVAWDLSGELLEILLGNQPEKSTSDKEEALKRLRQGIREADAVLFCIPCTQSSGGGSPLRFSDFAACLDLLETDAHGESRTPVVVLITKADTITGDSQSKLCDPVRSAQNLVRNGIGGRKHLRSHLAKADEAGRLVLRTLFPDMLDALDSQNREFAVFPVSSWGKEPLVEVGPPPRIVVARDEAELNPWNIHLPLIWIADRLWRGAWPALLSWYARRALRLGMRVGLLASVIALGVAYGPDAYQAFDRWRNPPAVTVEVAAAEGSPALTAEELDQISLRLEERGPDGTGTAPIAVKATDPVVTRIQPGTYRLTAEHPDWKPFETLITVTNRSRMTVPVRLTPRPGWLQLALAPTGLVCEVRRADGKPLGTTMPEAETHTFSLEAGSHALSLAAEHYALRTTNVTIAPNRTNVLSVELEPLPGQIILTNIPPGATVDGLEVQGTTYAVTQVAPWTSRLFTVTTPGNRPTGVEAGVGGPEQTAVVSLAGLVWAPLQGTLQWRLLHESREIPPGAPGWEDLRVTLDGRPVSPAVRTLALPPGRYELQAVHPDFALTTTAVSVRDQEVQQADLVLVARPSRVEVIPPEGIEGRVEVAAGTGVQVDEHTWSHSGSLTLRFVAPGYLEVTQEFAATPNGRRTWKPSPLPAPGKVRVVNIPTDCLLNGERTSGVWTSEPLAPGRPLSLEFRRHRFLPLIYQAGIERGGQTVTVDVAQLNFEIDRDMVLEEARTALRENRGRIEQLVATTGPLRADAASGELQGLTNLWTQYADCFRTSRDLRGEYNGLRQYIDRNTKAPDPEPPVTVPRRPRAGRSPAGVNP